MNPTITIASSDTGSLSGLANSTILPATAAAGGAMMGFLINDKSPMVVCGLAAIGAFLGSMIANAPPKLDSTSPVPGQ